MRCLRGSILTNKKTPSKKKAPRGGVTRSETTERQISELDMAIRRRGWSNNMASAMAKRWGVKTPRVYEVRKRVLDRMVQDDDQTLEERRSQFLAELRDVRQQAREDGRWGPVSAMMKMEAQILGLFAPIEIRIDANPVGGLSDSELEAILMAEERATRSRNGQVIEAEFSTVVRAVKG